MADFTAEDIVNQASMPAPHAALTAEDFVQSQAPSEMTAEDFLAQQAPPETSVVDKVKGFFNRAAAEPDVRPAVPEVAKSFDSGINPLNATASIIPSVKDFYSGEHGYIMKTLFALTVPEQIVARNVVGFMSNLGMMDSQKAKEILSQGDVHGHDIVNAYWREPGGWGERTARFVTGLATDILIDPLSYLGIGAMTEAAKSTTIGGKTITGLEKMALPERQFFDAAHEIEKIVTADNKIINPMDVTPAEAIQANTSLLNGFTNKQISLDELKSSLIGIPDSTRMAVEDAYKEAFLPKGYAGEWAAGKRGLTIGFKVPFTNLAKEIDMPFTQSASKAGGELADRFIKASANLLEPVNNEVVKFVGRAADSFFTKSGYSLYDQALNFFRGAKSSTDEFLNGFNDQWRTALKDATPEQVKDIVDQLEKHVDDPAATLERFGLPTHDAAGNPTKEFLKLQPKEEDLARVARMPEAHMAFVKEARSLMQKKADEYAVRPGIPFEELNPFGPGWANNYLGHIITNDWFERFKGSSDAAQYGLDYLAETTGKVDKGAFGRKYRGTINEANDLAKQAFGVKKYVDDPVEIVSRRVRDMDRTIRQYDLMESAIPHAMKILPGDAIPEGYVRFNADHWRELGQAVKTGTEEGDKYLQFIPSFYKDTTARTYLPSEVYDSMLHVLNPKQYAKPVQMLVDGVDKFNRIFRNNALFGAGYLGMKAVGDVLSYMSSGVTDPIKSLVEATSLMMPKWTPEMLQKAQYVFKDPEGVPYTLTREELWQGMLEHNVTRSSQIDNLGMSFGDLAENVASNREVRKSLGQKIEKFHDAAMLWGANRHIMQTSGDIPKAAIFIDRLKDGFTMQAAADAAEKYFYNFNNINQGTKAMSQVFPFTSMSIKTLERVASELKAGELGRLSIPYKVASVLEGTFVPDPDVRATLSEQLPSFDWQRDQIHGPLLPGQREILGEIPWVQDTLKFFFDPKLSLHPAIKAIGAWATAKDYREYNDITPKEELKQKLADSVSALIPSYLREGLALAEMNGVFGDTFGGAFSRKYAQNLPLKPGTNALANKFDNALAFGQYMETGLGKNWLYRLVFPREIDVNNLNLADQKNVSERGNWIKTHFRDITLGLSRLTDMDQNFFTNMGALNRQYDKLKDELAQDQEKIGYLPNIQNMTPEEIQKKMAATNPKAAKLMEIDFKKEVLKGYYDWYVGVEKQYPHADPWSLLFGGGAYKFDKSGFSELKSNLKQLDPRHVNINEYAQQVLKDQNSAPSADENKND